MTNETIDSLCVKLGVAVDALVPELQRVYVLNNIMWAVAILVAAAGLTYLTRKLHLMDMADLKSAKQEVRNWNKIRQDKVSDWYFYDGQYRYLKWMTGFASALLVILSLFNIIDAIRWTVSPLGMCQS